jgi:preprotein translocase subunit SecG
MDILVQIVQVLYVLITVVLILVVLLQAGRGGGLGTALGGGASQSVFGGSGGADFLAKLTQGLAVGFMVCAVYLAYASAHSGSSRLQEESKKLAGDEMLADEDEAVDYERVGPNPLQLPPPGGKPAPGDTPEDEAEAPADDAAVEAEPVEGEDEPT